MVKKCTWMAAVLGAVLAVGTAAAQTESLAERFAESRTMSPEVLRKLRDLVSAGAHVLGPKPDRVPGLRDYPNADAEVQRLADELWSGKIEHGRTVGDVLAGMGVAPDFEEKHQARLWGNDPGRKMWIHRRIDGTDIYFVRNPENKALTLEASFRVSGRIPELWHPDTGTIEDALDWLVENGRTRVQIPMDPHGSVFVVFRKEGTPPATRRVLREISAVEISTPWELSFPPQPPYGDKTPPAVTLGTLISWQDHEDDDIRHFSGTAVYRTTFDAPTPGISAPESRIFLDLGNVEVIAEVVLNGKNLGILWKPPFRVELGDALKSKANNLEIRVTNLWVNQLIGDERKPAYLKWGPDGRPAEWPDWLIDGGPVPETGRATFATWKFFNATDPLVPSGLLGPVRLVTKEKSVLKGTNQ